MTDTFFTELDRDIAARLSKKQADTASLETLRTYNRQTLGHMRSAASNYYRELNDRGVTVDGSTDGNGFSVTLSRKDGLSSRFDAKMSEKTGEVSTSETHSGRPGDTHPGNYTDMKEALEKFKKAFELFIRKFMLQ